MGRIIVYPDICPAIKYTVIIKYGDEGTEFANYEVPLQNKFKTDADTGATEYLFYFRNAYNLPKKRITVNIERPNVTSSTQQNTYVFTREFS